LVNMKVSERNWSTVTERTVLTASRIARHEKALRSCAHVPRPRRVSSRVRFSGTLGGTRPTANRRRVSSLPTGLR
jgi:hypothetical protein